MFSWFTSKSVERTKEVLENPFAVYDLTFLEWEDRETLQHQQKTLICAKKLKKSSETKAFEVIFKKDRLLIFSLFRSIERGRVDEVFNTVHPMLNCLSDGIVSKKPTVIAPILRTIVESTINQPKWTCAHIAAKAGLDQLFLKRRTDIMNNLNSQSPPDMSTPLHLAIESGRLSTTKAVLSLRPKTDAKNELADRPIHWAAMSNKEILRLFLKESNAMDMLKWTNRNGCTPLHLASYASKYDNVIQLLQFGLTVQMLTISPPIKKPKGNQNKDKIVRFTNDVIEDLDTEDMRFGGTPLHWVKHRRTLETLIGYGFELDVVNMNKQTALHLMVHRLRLKCLIGLLCFGAKVSRKDKSGDTPLHYAIRAADVTSAQALIIFDAKIDVKNNKHETPRHIAAQTTVADHHMVLYLLSAIGAKRCDPGMEGCKTGCAHNGSYEGKPYHRWPTYDTEKLYKPVLLEPVVRQAVERKRDKNLTTIAKRTRMCCLDGGGVRGLITIQILIQLERRLKELSGIKDDKISNYFDWVAGTSTGSILSLLIATGRSLTEVRGIYFRFKDKILIGSRPYSSEKFETLLRDEIGALLHMSDIYTKNKKRLIINATLIDRNPAKLHLFRSYESPEEVLGLPQTLHGFRVYPNHKEQFAWEACRASGAAPTYFRSYGPFLDGGLIANNPTLDAMAEFKLYNNALKAVGRVEESEELEVVVSFGTGKFTTTVAEPIDVEKIWSFSPRELHKNALYVTQMGNLLINQVTATEGHVIDRAQAWCSGTKTPYFRINPTLSEVIHLAERDDVEICNAVWETKAFMHAMREEVENLVELLRPTVPSVPDESTQPNPRLRDANTASTGYIINMSSNDIQIKFETLPQNPNLTEDTDRTKANLKTNEKQITT